MNIAYCVICHKNTKILQETIDLLYRENDIYIHVDKKTDFNQFLSLKEKVYFLYEREIVSWGSFSQVEVMLKLLKSTYRKNYDYIVLLSGDCLPLKNSSEIKKFLLENNGNEYIGVVKNIDQENLINRRVKYKYPNKFFKKYDQKSYFEKIITKIQFKWNIFLKNKYYDELPKLYKGSQWFIITTECRDYIFNYLEKNPNYKKAFYDSYCGDEIFFQTIICNSKYKNKIYKIDQNDDNLMALRYIDWKSGPEYPKILNENDYEKIKKTNCLFGRKFDQRLNINDYEKYFIKKQKKYFSRLNMKKLDTLSFKKVKNKNILEFVGSIIEIK